MIKSYLFGGIGNQLFQYVSALQLADLINKKIVFDYELIHGFRSYHKSKIYDLFNFKKNVTFFNNKFKIKNKVFLKTKIYYLNLLRRFNFSKNIICEKNFFNLSKKIIKFQQYGYFQDLKFIQIKLLKLKKILVFKKKFYQIKNYKKIINNKNSVSIHIRGGDYLSRKSRKKFLVLNEKYYKKAILFIKKKIKNPFFFIFTNDINYSTLIIKKVLKKEKFQFINDITDCHDFFLMSQCKNFIISNSTFSWWSSYLCTYKKKIIICPKKWFVKHIDNVNNNLILKSWIKI
jgi:hypothetical protein